ncbi:MAG: hydrogenase maturation nickel metallochaperone HypA [Bacteroidetes bacterium]|nr:hydrogenase maturation nickel metallochaperone HypA [Bacteroidota bacterium]
MHELSLVLNIIDIAEEEVKKAHAHRVDAIDLEVGSLAGVEIDALKFSWDAAVKDTVLEKAERTIDQVQAVARCSNCGCEYLVHEPFEPCPACNEVLVEYLKGKELRVKSLVVS